MLKTYCEVFLIHNVLFKKKWRIYYTIRKQILEADKNTFLGTDAIPASSFAAKNAIS